VELYTVLVRNELTGEMATVSIPCWSCHDAQVEALSQLFKSRGWRKACAFQAEPAPASDAADQVIAVG
jgi:hypothetical protein